MKERVIFRCCRRQPWCVKKHSEDFLNNALKIYQSYTVGLQCPFIRQQTVFFPPPCCCYLFHCLPTNPYFNLKLYTVNFETWQHNKSSTFLLFLTIFFLSQYYFRRHINVQYSPSFTSIFTDKGKP